MSKYTILYVNESPAGNSIASSLRTGTDQLITATSASQAVALLYVNRRIDAVILDQRSGEHAGPGLARVLRSVRADVPILLVSAHRGEPMMASSTGADNCVCVGDDINELVPVLNMLLPTPAEVAC